LWKESARPGQSFQKTLVTFRPRRLTCRRLVWTIAHASHYPRESGGHGMKGLSVVALVVLAASTCAGADLPRSRPEAQGVPPPAVLAFVEAADRDIDSLHSFMLVRRGHVVAEGWWAPYAADTPHMLFSLSKSFTSTAVGLAVAEGKLSIDDPVLKFFPDDAPAEPRTNL